MSDLYLDADYIDINLTSSLDFQKNLTDYISVITNFPEEVVISNVYRHTDSHSDPITSKIQFFKNLNAGDLAVKEHIEGSVSTKADIDSLRNKNIRDQLSRDQHISTASGNKYDKPNMIGDDTVKVVYRVKHRVWEPIDPENTDVNANGRWVEDVKMIEGEQPVIVSSNTTDTELAQTAGMKDMSPWFVLHWMEKFYTAHETIKSDLIELLGDDNEYFVKFSESVGQLKNIKSAEDTSTLPLWDETVEALSTIPCIITPVAKYCIREETLNFSEEISKRTNALYRQNMRNIQDDPSKDIPKHKQIVFSTMSHGINNVCDSSHRTRVYNFIDTVREAIQEHLKGLYDVLELLSNRVNHMMAAKPKEINMKVEDYTVSVDLLKNKIKSYDKELTDVTTSTYGRPGYYNTNITNASMLATPGIQESPPDPQ